MRWGGNRIRLKKKEGLKTNFERSFYMVIDSSIGARLSWPYTLTKNRLYFDICLK